MTPKGIRIITVLFNSLYLILKVLTYLTLEAHVLIGLTSGVLLLPLVHLAVAILAVVIVYLPRHAIVRALSILLIVPLLWGMFYWALVVAPGGLGHMGHAGQFTLSLLDNVMLVFNFMIAVNFQSLARSN